MPVANVARAYRINDFTLVPGFNLPLNVLLELAWTWIGATPGRPTSIQHSRVRVIAIAFAKAIRAL